MLENIILGTIQGIAEWLPVSSEGLIFLVKTNFFQAGTVDELIHQALFLHLGTFFAALIYFRKEVWFLLKNLFKYKKAESETKKVLNFLIISFLISGTLGYVIIRFLASWDIQLESTGKIITAGIGILLLITAVLQLKAKKIGLRKYANIKKGDGILLGFMQTLAALPGLSRSGLTVSALLLRKFDDHVALKLSFLMSLPITLAGNIFYNLNYFNISKETMIGLACSFIFGFITIGALLKIAKKINFGYFVLGFAILTLLAALI